MALKFLTPETRDEFVQRFMSIQADTRPKWGTMTSSRMLSHLRYFFNASNGTVQMPDQSNFITRTIAPWLFFHLFTNWPKGRLKVPEQYTPPPDDDFERERELTIQAM